MRYITATEANQNMSRVLRDVAAGSTYTVTSRGKAVAKVVPVDEELEKGKDLSELFAFLDTLTPVCIGPWKREELYERE